MLLILFASYYSVIQNKGGISSFSLAFPWERMGITMMLPSQRSMVIPAQKYSAINAILWTSATGVNFRTNLQYLCRRPPFSRKHDSAVLRAPSIRAPNAARGVRRNTAIHNSSELCDCLGPVLSHLELRINPWGKCRWELGSH